MTLVPGINLGPYEVTAQIGQGGMGFVGPVQSHEPPCNEKETAMGTQDNVQTVQQLYAAFDRGDIDAIINSLMTCPQWLVHSL